MKAYLLAAGRGARAGGPKAWKLHEGKTLLERQIEFLLTQTKAEEIHVSVQPEWAERCKRIDARVHWVPADPDQPAFASLQALVKAAAPGWATLHHVDMPVWDDALFRALRARAVSNCGAEAIVPVFDGRRGHPVILSPRLQRRVAGEDAATARLDVLLREARVDELPVQAACVLENWNR